MTQVQPHYYYV